MRPCGPGQIIFIRYLTPLCSDNCTEDFAFNRPITIEEVHSVVTRLEESKAPGLDKICQSILKDDRIIDFVVFKKAFDSIPRELLWH